MMKEKCSWTVRSDCLSEFGGEEESGPKGTRRMGKVKTDSQPLWLLLVTGFCFAGTVIGVSIMAAKDQLEVAEAIGIVVVSILIVAMVRYGRGLIETIASLAKPVANEPGEN